MQTKANLHFNINTFARLPRMNADDPEAHSWVLTGGRLGHIGIWALRYVQDETDKTMQLHLKGFVDPPLDTHTEVIQKFELLPPDWSCFEPAGGIKAPHQEVLVLSLGRRKENQGTSLYYLQLNLATGQAKVNYKRFHRWPGVNSKAYDMCIWENKLVVGLGQMITIIPRFEDRLEDRQDQLV